MDISKDIYYVKYLKYKKKYTLLKNKLNGGTLPKISLSNIKNAQGAISKNLKLKASQLEKNAQAQVSAVSKNVKSQAAILEKQAQGKIGEMSKSVKSKIAELEKNTQVTEISKNVKSKIAEFEKQTANMDKKINSQIASLNKSPNMAMLKTSFTVGKAFGKMK